RAHQTIESREHRQVGHVAGDLWSALMLHSLKRPCKPIGVVGPLRIELGTVKHVAQMLTRCIKRLWLATSLGPRKIGSRVLGLQRQGQGERSRHGLGW